jgi:hypothetical protein
MSCGKDERRVDSHFKNKLVRGIVERSYDLDLAAAVRTSLGAHGEVVGERSRPAASAEGLP